MSVVQRLDGLKAEVREGLGEKIVALRRDIHREPELGFGTEKTAEKVIAALDGLPLEIKTGVAENGIVATLRGEGEGPVVGLRAGHGRPADPRGDRPAVRLREGRQDARLRPRRAHEHARRGGARALGDARPR